MSEFRLGAQSLARLAHVDERLAAVVRDAITRTTVDFAVHEGLRTLATQREYVRRGVSRTMHSKHLRGLAVDLVPWVGGQLRWEWPLIYPIAAAMRDAAVAVDLPLTWGGAWDTRLNSLDSTERAMREAVLAYCARHPGPDFIDGPHYEIAE